MQTDAQNARGVQCVDGLCAVEDHACTVGAILFPACTQWFPVNFNVAAWHPIQTHNEHAFQPQDQLQHDLQWYPLQEDTTLQLAFHPPKHISAAPDRDADSGTGQNSLIDCLLSPY
eukprot:632590-Rhodomonas_salina.1